MIQVAETDVSSKMSGAGLDAFASSSSLVVVDDVPWLDCCSLIVMCYRQPQILTRTACLQQAPVKSNTTGSRLYYLGTVHKF
jgi:hypothetical protein